jgi:hypothetical protein
MSIGDAQGGGVSGFGVAKEEQKPIGGTGGAAGPGTRAGEGDPSGQGIGTGQEDALALKSGSEAAAEAGALGDLDDHDETPALEYGEGDRPRGPTVGEAIGSGAGTNVGSGTDPERPIG